MKYALLFYFFSIAIFPKAQPKEASYQHYNTDNGLPQNSVKDIEFDKNGFCWLSTEVGAVRFDGSNFKLFMPTDCPSKRTTNFRIDKTNEIIVDYEYPFRYKINIDKKNKVTFKKYQSYDKQYYQKGYNVHLSKNIVFSIIGNPKKGEVNDGSIFGIKNTIFYRMFNNDIEYFGEKGQRKLLKIDDIILPEYRNVTIVGQDLVVWDKKKNLFNAIRSGKLFIQNKPIVGDFKKENTANIHWKLHWTRFGTFISGNNKLYKIEIVGNSLVSTLIFENLPFKDAESLYYNPTLDKYFVGTINNGLFILNKRKFEVTKISGSNTALNVFYSQALLDNKIFANGYIFKEDGVQKKITDNINQLNLFESGDNTFWFSKQSSPQPTVVNHNFKNGNIKEYKLEISEIPSCFAINKADSTVFIATSNHLGKITKSKVEWLKLFFNYKISNIQFYDKENLYIGTQNGLYSLNIISKKLTTIVKTGEFRTIYQDNWGNWWFGTYGQGYYLLKKSGLVKLPIDNYGRLNFVHSFYIDNRKRIWMSTNNGLLAIEVDKLLNYRPTKNQSLPFRIFDKNDGLMTNEFNGGGHPPVLELPNGKLSLPSMEGLVLFKPSDINFSQQPATIYFENIICNKQPYKIEENLTLPENAKQIIFETSSPYFGKKEEVSFVYRLNNANEWTEINDEKIIFEELPAKKYLLEIKIDGQNETISRINFVIKPHFYQTWWFYLLLFLCFMISLYSYFRFRLDRVKKRNTILRKTVEERTEVLNETIKKLDQNLIKLEESEAQLGTLVVVQEKMLNLVVHDLRSPLILLKKVSDDSINYFSKNDKIATERSIIALNSGIEEIKQFSENFFEWIFMQKDGLKPKNETFYFVELFKELSNLFNAISNQNEFEFLHNDLAITSDRNMLTIILRNLIDNANKNTFQGKIEVESIQVKNKILVTIIDNGKGISDKKIEEIKNVIKSSNTNSTEKSFGYKIILELIQLLQGDIEVERLQKGTKITLTFYQ